MLTEQDFMADIIADGESNTTRLVLADWLEEQGDVDRAEFIRLQCLGADKEREHELLEKNYSLWCLPYASVLKDIIFKRGLIHSGCLISADVKIIPESINILKLHVGLVHVLDLLQFTEDIRTANIKEIHAVIESDYFLVSNRMKGNKKFINIEVLSFNHPKVLRESLIWSVHEGDSQRLFDERPLCKSIKLKTWRSESPPFQFVRLFFYDNFSGRPTNDVDFIDLVLGIPYIIGEAYSVGEFTPERVIASFYRYGMCETYVD